jgi:hypothetical protein
VSPIQPLRAALGRTVDRVLGGLRRARHLAWQVCCLPVRGIVGIKHYIGRVLASLNRCLHRVLDGISHGWSWVLSRPLRAYNALKRHRDWVLVKVEYLQSESAKWRTAFNILKSPYSFLRMMGLSPQLAVSFLAIGGVASGGVVVSETLLAGRSFARGDSGVYLAPDDIPVFYDEANNTLLITLGANEVGEIDIEDVTVGTAFSGSVLPSGETNVVFIGGLPTDGGFAETFIEVNHLIVDRWRCDQFELSDSEVFELNVKWNVSDGQSISPVNAAVRPRAIGGGNRAVGMTTTKGLYDQIRIEASTSGVNGKADVLRLFNLQTKGGLCKLSRIKAHTIDILFGETGLGDGFAAKDFVIASTTVYDSFSNISNIEEAISPP